MDSYKFNAITRTPQSEVPTDYTFSAFTGIADTNPQSYTLTELAEAISNGTFKMSTDQVRCATSKDDRSRIKRGLPAFSISGLFRGGHEVSNLVTHSGLICMDFDPDTNPKLLEDTEEWRDKLAEDEFSLFPFISVSGKGIAVIVRIEGDRHEEAFRNLEAYYYDKFGLTADPAPKSVASLRFPSCDFSAEINWDARLFRRYSLAKERETTLLTQINSSSVPPSDERRAEIHSALLCLSPNDRTAWRDVGMAMKLESNSIEMFDLWDGWSQRTTMDNYDQIANQKQWNSFKVGITGGITMSTVFGWARDNDWDWSKPPVAQHIVDEWLAGAERFRSQRQAEAEHKRHEVEEMVVIEPVEELKADGTITAVDAADYLRDDPPPTESVLENFFDVGDKVAVIGKSKSKKTFLTTQMALCIATGKDFLGWKVNKRRKILFVQLEVKPAHFHARIHKVAKGLGITFDELKGQMLIVNGRGKGITAEVVLGMAKKFESAVVCIDPTYKILQGDENGAEDWKPLLNTFDRITESGATVIYVLHDKKGTVGGMDSTDRGAGSGIVARDYDAGMTITHADEGSIPEDEDAGDYRIIEAIKRNYADEEPTVAKWIWQDCTFEIKHDSEVTVQTPASKMNAAKAKDKGKPRVDWAEIAQVMVGEVMRKEVTSVNELYQFAASMASGAAMATVRKRVHEHGLYDFFDEAGIEKRKYGRGRGLGVENYIGTAKGFRAFEKERLAKKQGDLGV